MQVKIEQRIPIARIFTASGNSFYIDKEGLQLPLKQLTVLRLPVFTNFPSDQEKLSKPDSLLLNDILHFTQAVATDSFFMAQTAQVNIASNGDFELVQNSINSISNNLEEFSKLISNYKNLNENKILNSRENLEKFKNRRKNLNKTKH